MNIRDPLRRNGLLARRDDPSRSRHWTSDQGTSDRAVRLDRPFALNAPVGNDGANRSEDVGLVATALTQADYIGNKRATKTQPTGHHGSHL